MGRRLTRLLGVLVLLIVVALVALYLTIDSIAKAGVEKGGTYALGTETRVDSASVSLLRGSLGLSELTVDNPAGWSSAKILRAGNVTADVKTGSLFSDVVEVPLIEISDLEVNIEQRLGANNVSDVVNHIKGLSAGGAAKAEGGRRVKIALIRLKNITANVQLLPVGGQVTTVPVQVDLLEFKDITEGVSGSQMSDVIARVFPALISGIVKKGVGVPADLAGKLSADAAAAAQSLGQEGAKLLDQAGKAATGVKDAVDETGKKIGEIFK